jgi:exodeoxyribonuclease-5
MVPEYLAEWLMAYHIPIITLGDLNQLPPVMGKRYFLENVDCVLTQIMRQSDESPIPYFAKKITDGEFTRFYEFNIQDKIIMKKFSKVTDYDISSSNIVICHTNKRRDYLNTYIREQIYGYTNDYPMIGDKMICRENNWNQSICDGIFLINGMIGYIDDIDLRSLLPSAMTIDFRPEFLERDKYVNIVLDRTYLNLSREEKVGYHSKMNKFEYGYAITCHLAQGSQYKKVLIDVDSLYGLNRTYAKQWFYTAITRAIDEVIIAY